MIDLDHVFGCFMADTALDIVILSNGPGEVATWVKPVVRALGSHAEAARLRISVLLSPCPHASGNEHETALSYPEVDRVQAADDFFRFLLTGKTADGWDWHPQGVVVFLGGDHMGGRIYVGSFHKIELTGKIQPQGILPPLKGIHANPGAMHRFA